MNRTPDEIDVHDDDLTVAEAAALAGVEEGTIRVWKHRGHLPAAGYDGQGRPLFRALDVARAEHATRAKARRE